MLTNPIAAPRPAARIRTSICVVVVPVIAGLKAFLLRRQISSHDAITATRSLTAVTASVQIGLVAIIAVFTWLNDPVAAARHTAPIGASINVDLIPVIAGLKILALRVEIRAHDAITTPSQKAVVAARVRVAHVSIITLFTGLDDPVTTVCRGALVGAIILVVVVTVVAGFTALPNDAIAAGGDGSGIGAVVVIDRVAIFTRLKALLAYAEI